MQNKSKKEKNTLSNKPITKRADLHFPIVLWDELYKKAQEEQIRDIPNMTIFIIKICRDYLSGKSSVKVIDLETEQLLEHQKRLQEKEYEFVNNLNSLLNSAKKEQKPENYEIKMNQVLKSIGGQKLKFNEIAEVTQIPKEELIIIMANLVDEMKVRFDDKWRYSSK